MKNRFSKSLLAMFLGLFNFNFSVSGMYGNINNINNEVVHNERANEAIEPGQIITDEMLGIKSMSLKNVNKSKDKVIDYDKPLNLLVVADDEKQMQKVTALLCENNPNLSLGDLESKFKNYKSGGIYKFINQPNIRVLCFTFDDILSDKFKGWFNSYKWDFICQNTSKMFCIFNNDKKDFMRKIKDFYDFFNKHWCGSDFDYDSHKYDGGINRDNWFEPVRIKRKQNGHRYMFMIYYGAKVASEEDKGYRELHTCICQNSHKEYCQGCFSNYYIVRMPDARGIAPQPLTNELKANFFRDEFLFKQRGDDFPYVDPFTRWKVRHECCTWDAADNDEDVKAYQNQKKNTKNK